MPKLKINKNPAVEDKFSSYPKQIKSKMKNLRKLVLEVAKEDERITEIEETLKWGEPSYLVKKGSTVRLDWKAKAPDQYAIYFKCTSKLVTTFREVYGDQFNYEKNRAILFSLDDKVPTEELKKCVSMAFNYHLLKDQPLLGHKQ